MIIKNYIEVYIFDTALLKSLIDNFNKAVCGLFINGLIHKPGLLLFNLNKQE